MKGSRMEKFWMLTDLRKNIFAPLFKSKYF